MLGIAVSNREPHAERAHHQTEEEGRAVAEGNRRCSFNRPRPWEWVWRQACGERERAGWWKDEFTEPAGLLLNGSVNESELLDGDAPVAGGSSTAVGSGSAHEDTGGADSNNKRKRQRARKGKQQHAPNYDDDDDDEPPLKKREFIERAHMVDSKGFFTHNRRRQELCSAFGQGKCKKGRGIQCPKDPRKVHQCAKCLSPAHGVHKCKSKTMPKKPRFNQRSGDSTP